MATINGLTAERMQEIVDKTIVDADVVGNNLILTLNDDTTIDAGDVRGPAGEPGITDMEEQIAAALSLADPPGTPKPYTGAAAPTGHGLCDAATEWSSATYPILATLYGTGAGCVNGASSAGTFRLPNLKGKVLVGKDAAVSVFDTLHETGGSKDAANVIHNHTADQDLHSHSADQPPHDHGIPVEGNHDHTAVEGDSFAVSVGGPQNDRLVQNSQGIGSGAYITFSSADEAGSHSHGGVVAATDSVITIGNTDPAITVANSGASGVDGNLQPYRIINWIMRLV